MLDREHAEPQWVRQILQGSLKLALDHPFLSIFLGLPLALIRLEVRHFAELSLQLHFELRSEFVVFNLESDILDLLLDPGTYVLLIFLRSFL